VSQFAPHLPASAREHTCTHAGGRSCRISAQWSKNMRNPCFRHGAAGDRGGEGRVREYSYVDTYTYTYMYTCIHVYMYTCIHVYIYMYTYMCTYIYICIYIYIYTYIHVYTYKYCFGLLGACAYIYTVFSLSLSLSLSLSRSLSLALSLTCSLSLLKKMRRYRDSISCGKTKYEIP
jgi:hypothetical protein